MITTIEGRIQNGVIVPMDPILISTGSRVLITILADAKDNKLQWDKCKREAGWLSLDKDPVAWQQNIRDEWTSRL